MWKLNLPLKIKTFFWALCTMKLPTKDALLVKQVRCDPFCPLCGLEVETIIHLFANCSFARECWTVLNPTWQLGMMESVEEWID